MTITYQYNVSTSSFFGFGKLLLRWRGSIYKLIFKELLAYASAFLVIAIAYRTWMTQNQKSYFERLSQYCDKTLELIPLSFVLGFYVTFVVTRWWNQFATIPWPDRLMHVITMYVDGNDERGRLLRRTLIRYVNLCSVILFQSISGAVKRRFPTIHHLVLAGFMTVDEKCMFEEVQTSVNKHFIPMVWFVNLLNMAHKEGRVPHGPAMKHLLEEVNEFRSKTGMLWCYDWVTVPLVYTQVVTLTTHFFFVTCLIGRQYLDPTRGYKNNELDVYFPGFTFLQFMFFMGWLKVAEQLINPFGEDDDDFETNWLIDRNLQVSYLVVDDLYGKVPPIERDIYWFSTDPQLPYTEASLLNRNPTYEGSTVHMVIPPNEQEIVYSDGKIKGGFIQCQPCFCFPNIFCQCTKPAKKSTKKNRIVRSNKSLALKETNKKAVIKTLGHKDILFNASYLNTLNRGISPSDLKGDDYLDTDGEEETGSKLSLELREAPSILRPASFVDRSSSCEDNRAYTIEEDSETPQEKKEEVTKSSSNSSSRTAISASGLIMPSPDIILEPEICWRFTESGERIQI